MLDESIKFQPRRENPEGDSAKSVNTSRSNHSPPSKPFKDLLDKESGESDRQLLSKTKDALEGGEDPILTEDILASADTVSIYDLSKKPAVRDPVPFKMKQPEEQTTLGDSIPPSPDQLFRTISKHENKAVPTANEHTNLEGKIHGSDVQKALTGKENPKLVDEESLASFYQPQTEKKETRLSASFSKEQPDLSYINPLSVQQSASNNISNFSTEKPILPQQHLQQIVEQIAKEMQIREFQGKTETTVVLNQPGIFKGAEVVVTSFDTARGQFNVTFQNLGPQAKMMFDAQATQDSLRHALEVKGYMVHIVVATTGIDQPTIATNADNQSRGTREEGGQQQEEQEEQEKG